MDTSSSQLIQLLTNCNIMIALTNCNTMIDTNQNSHDELVEKHNQTIANIKKIDILISNAKDLHDRLDNIDELLCETSGVSSSGATAEPPPQDNTPSPTKVSGKSSSAPTDDNKRMRDTSDSGEATSFCSSSGVSSTGQASTKGGTNNEPESMPPPTQNDITQKDEDHNKLQELRAKIAQKEEEYNKLLQHNKLLEIPRGQASTRGGTNITIDVSSDDQAGNSASGGGPTTDNTKILRLIGTINERLSEKYSLISAAVDCKDDSAVAKYLAKVKELEDTKSKLEAKAGVFAPTPITDEEIELARRRRIERERVCRLPATLAVPEPSKKKKLPPTTSTRRRKCSVPKCTCNVSSSAAPPPDSSAPESFLQVPNNRREDVATELHYQHADEGLQDPIPIEVIMSLLEKHDDDAVATLHHMRSLESECDDEDDSVGSDFTDESSSDEESLCFSMMDGEEDDDDYDSSTSDDELLDKSTLALLEANRSSPNHPIHSFKPEDILLFDKSDRKKPSKKKKKCIVFGCTSNAVKGMLKCFCHEYPCSYRGCTKYGQVVSDNVRYCLRHAKTEAPEAYAQFFRQREGKKSMQKRRKCSVDGCTKTAMRGRQKCACHQYPCSYRGCTKYGQVVSDNVRYCQRHAQTEAPEAYAQYRERRNRYIAERRRTDVKFRLAMNLRIRLHDALKAQGTSYKGKNKLLGCTVDQFKRYLEQFFRERGNRWMNWDNQGRIEGVRCWEMDHIYPLSKLDLTDPEELKRAQHWSNFQPLSAAENNGKFTDIPDGFEWNGNRWMWSEESGRTNYELPAAGAEEDVTSSDDETDEFDGS